MMVSVCMHKANKGVVGVVVVVVKPALSFEAKFDFIAESKARLT